MLTNPYTNAKDEPRIESEKHLSHIFKPKDGEANTMSSFDHHNHMGSAIDDV